MLPALLAATTALVGLEHGKRFMAYYTYSSDSPHAFLWSRLSSLVVPDYTALAAFDIPVSLIYLTSPRNFLIHLFTSENCGDYSIETAQFFALISS